MKQIGNTIREYRMAQILLEGAVPQKARKTVEAYEVEDALQVTYYISSTEKKTMIIPCPEE